jgi:hypothetical protein
MPRRSASDQGAADGEGAGERPDQRADRIASRQCGAISLRQAIDAGGCRWGGENLDLYCATAAVWGLDHRPQPHQAA